MIALVPARAGSKRLPGKNLRLLNGHPLLAYTIAAALESRVFERVYVSSEDVETLAIASHYGAMACGRSPELATDDAPDIWWVRDLLKRLPRSDSFAILRPTSPFRTAETIQRAYEAFIDSTWDSLRAVEPVTEHPGKMWVLDTSVYGGSLIPLIAGEIEGVPWHSCPTQRLPKIYTQNSSLEMAWTRTVFDQGTISGTHIGPFLTDGPTGFAIDTPDDWDRAVALAAASPALLPALHVAPLSPTPDPYRLADSGGTVAGRVWH